MHTIWLPLKYKHNLHKHKYIVFINNNRSVMCIPGGKVNYDTPSTYPDIIRGERACDSEIILMVCCVWGSGVYDMW